MPFPLDCDKSMRADYIGCQLSSAIQRLQKAQRTLHGKGPGASKWDVATKCSLAAGDIALAQSWIDDCSKLIGEVVGSKP